PNASQVAKVLRGGVAGYALSIAVQELLGSVDWVLDPANNQIVYKPRIDLSCVDATKCDPTAYYLFRRTPTVTTYYTTTEAACSAVASSFGQTFVSVIYKTYDSFGRVNGGTCSTRRTDGSSDTWRLDVPILNPSYDPDKSNEEKKISLDVVAQKVIDIAESSSNNDHKVGAQVATTAASQDMLANDAATQSDVETQLNTNAKTQTSEEATGNTKPNEANPEITDISLNFPAFCGWAPSVCEAANVVINFPNTLTNWWTTATTSISDAWTWTKARYEASVTSISDFFKNEPDQTDNTDLPVQEIPTPQLETNAFSATPGCPEPIPIQIKIGVEGTAHISYEPICQFAEKWSFIAPLIGFLSGAMIIVGVGRKGEDSEI
ncbi:MAG: virulence factor TspB C-terminal domain-related protein, partial [Acinetobacter junii]